MSASAAVSGSGVYREMKFEGGVHRVQRIPQTETKGRTHTSTMTVAILPQPSEVSVIVQILCIGTDRSQQTVQTKIRLLLKKQSDKGLRCLPFHQHLLDALMRCYIKLFYF